MSGPTPRPTERFRSMPPTVATASPPTAPNSTRSAPDGTDTSGIKPAVAVPTTSNTNAIEPSIPSAAWSCPAAAAHDVRTATAAIAAAAHQG
jgi:hypothetical protein